MEKDSFIAHIYRQLKKMSMEQKDEWILTRAKLLLESEQQDFIMSLSGEKKIEYMPTRSDIDNFCEEVKNGDIYIEYETHYYEFGPDGRYMDDWKVQHNDPEGAFTFLDRVFRGCHDLIRLGEYNLAGQILDKVCRLEFKVVEAEDSESGDFVEGSLFTIADAQRENLLSVKGWEIAYDWIETLLLGESNNECMEFAGKLVNVLCLELCEKVQVSDFSANISKELLDFIEKVLEREIETICADLEKITDKSRYWRENRRLEKSKTRRQHLLLDIRKNCRKQENNILDESKHVSVLQASWEQICEMINILRYERYIDDQPEIEEIWNICQALVKRNRFGEEEWKIRKNILKDMVEHEYYDYYGCCDPMKELAAKLYITNAETLEYADLLSGYYYYAREAADLYRQYGRMDRYIQYLETHLEKSSREYVELIQCYCNDGNKAGAREVAEQGLKRCKDDLTELFIFLLQDARNAGNEVRYKKFYASAKRRQKADINRIEKALLEENKKF